MLHNPLRHCVSCFTDLPFHPRSRILIYSSGSSAAWLPCQSVVFHNFHPTKVKRRLLNEEIPIYICCPCHGAQPVRRHRRTFGKGRCDAHRDVVWQLYRRTYGVGAAAVNAVGTVTAIIDSAHATVNVTTAGVGIFDAAGGNVAAWTLLPANLY